MSQGKKEGQARKTGKQQDAARPLYPEWDVYTEDHLQDMLAQVLPNESVTNLPGASVSAGGHEDSDEVMQEIESGLDEVIEIFEGEEDQTRTCDLASLQKSIEKLTLSLGHPSKETSKPLPLFPKILHYF